MLTVLCCIAVLILVPIVRTNMFGLEPRQMTGGETTGDDQAQEGYVPYGYYPEDGWVEQESGFFVTTGELGIIELELFYPFEVVGDEKGKLYLNGELALDFEILQETTTLTVSAPTSQDVFIEIRCDFSREPENSNDKRRLAFVVQMVSAK